MTNAPSLYAIQEGTFERSFFPLLIISIAIHAAVLVGAALLPGFLGAISSKELPYEVMTVELLGALAPPPAPAAPPAPVDPDLRGPDVVELPQTELIVPQPTPLERMITPVTPPDIIPIGERPPDKPLEPVQKNAEPPPKVTLPDKVPEPKPKPKPQTKPKTPNNEAVLNSRIEEIRRRKEAEQNDQQIQAAIGNIAISRGQGTGVSSNPEAGNPNGAMIDPAKADYYYRIREIIRSNWLPPPMAMSPDLNCTFVIVIEPDGRISGVRMKQSSGVPEYDTSVSQAIGRSSLPGLPDVFEGKRDNPSFVFNYEYLNTAS
ncbi:MAG: TonB C-terminal domain-containing protein [Deltaproteobacteria bacterium]|jgi:outer membrane biosynthesis protein TonB|nr:TonB C-terminal domain-containing protein [Deltaproteobacteria bacterium]